MFFPTASCKKIESDMSTCALPVPLHLDASLGDLDKVRKWFNPHKLPYWRLETDYWMKESYLDPKSKDARFNSCNNPRLKIADVCSGRGSCLPFGDTGVSFCRCNPGFGGAECESKRLSQLTAWFLCLFLGPFGADQYYLGWYPEMLITQILSILGVVLLVAIPNSKLPGGVRVRSDISEVQSIAISFNLPLSIQRFAIARLSGAAGPLDATRGDHRVSPGARNH